MQNLILPVFALFFMKPCSGQVKLNSSMPKVVTADGYNQRNSTKIPLKMVISLNYGGYVLPVGPIATESIRFALNQMKKMPSFLENYQLVIETFDDQGSRTLTSKMTEELVNYLETPYRIPVHLATINSGIVGQGQVFKYLNICAIGSFSANSEPHLFPDRYANLFIAGLEALSGYRYVLPQFINQMGWKSVAIIGENSDFFSLYESSMMAEMEKLNGTVSLFRFLYISGAAPDSDQVEEAVRNARDSGARVIVIDVIASVRVACWMHRYGLFGPSRIIILYTAVAFAPGNIFRYQPWCTPIMIAEMLDSVFYFGTGSASNFNQFDIPDSSGTTGKMLDQYLNQQIASATSSSYYWFWRHIYYDATLIAGLVLNKTEAYLNANYNQTIADWFTGENSTFVDDDGKFVEILKRQIYGSKFQTQAGQVLFDEKSKKLETSNLYQGMFQVQRHNGTITMVPVARLLPNLTLEIHNENLKWRTRNGTIPPDSTIELIQTKPKFGRPLFIFLIVVAAILASVNVVLVLSLHVICRRSKYPLNIFIYFGNILLLTFVLVQPPDFDSSIRCSIALGCLAMGTSMIAFGITYRLEVYNYKAKKNQIEHVHGMKFRMTRRRTSQDGSAEKIISHHITTVEFIGLTVLIVIALLIVVWFASEPATMVETFSKPFTDPDDDFILHRTRYFTCQQSMSRISSIVIAAIYGLSLLFLAIRGVVAILALRTNKTQLGDDERSSLNAITNCFSGSIILTFCIGIISSLVFEINSFEGSLSVSCGIFLTTSLNMILIWI